MERQKLESLRARVTCAAVLQRAGFVLDISESSRRALKYRRRGEIVIVTHGGAGWFDPLSDKKGDVFSLVGLLEGKSFVQAVERLSVLEGIADLPAALAAPAGKRIAGSVAQRWSVRSPLSEGSPAYRYLVETRLLRPAVLHRAVEQDGIRQGPYGSAWFRHEDMDSFTVCGWEERGPTWRGFSTGGAKTLFRMGSITAGRVCITEAAIDALSLASLEQARADTLYASTGGGWSAATVAVIARLAGQGLLVAATDADPQGEAYADRLRQIAASAGAGFQRLRPKATDWNEELGQQCKP